VTFKIKTQIAGLVFLCLSSTAALPAPCPEDCGYSVYFPSTEVNIYSEISSEHMSPVVANALPRVYVPNHTSNTVSVIDPATHKVIDTYRVGQGPQHIIPSWDLKTLWVANTANQTTNGSMTPIDPTTGKPGKNIPVTDPYNMYYTPDGSSAIIVAEAYKKLDFRDPITMALQYTINAPICRGINHADYSADYSFMVITCEFGKISLIKVDMKQRKVVSGLVFSKLGMPQDVRLSPDGKTFYITDMMNDGVFLVDAATFKETGFIATGKGAHGLTTSRDGKRLFVGNRGSNRMPDKAGGAGSVSVIEFATNKVVAQWPIPGGGSPDMGNVTADGKELWLAGRYDGQVYAIDTTTGAVIKINVGIEPHGLTVWPQPGRFSLGHTGNMR
jgi:YVTN family beta-propeller protein